MRVSNRPAEQDLQQEHALVERARAGDERAFAALYTAYLPRLYRYCFGRVGNVAEAEDLAEEVFVKVLGGLATFEWRVASGAARSPFGSWLFRIAHNHVVSFHRRAVNRHAGGELPEDLRDDRRGPQELAETQLEIEEVFRVVRELPDAQRDVILLRFSSGLSVAETAAVLGKQQTNVKVLQHKGIRRLRALLAAGDEATVTDEQARGRA
jgi:RNA polymerase sigma-70 factor (ECF subfamily)